MPKEMEKRLRKKAIRLKNQGRLKGTVGSYVYGTLRKMKKGE